MNNTKNDVNSQISRMKALMTFGINEGKNVAYTGVEYEKVGADGKLYGIVREGSKYYIKTSPSKKGKLAENYDYIGGFRNRKDNEYSSFAEAQKQFDLKMMSINEANTPDKKVVVESWNPDKQEMLTVESTNKMKKEISRERQIMLNASRINEKKEQNLQPICDDASCKKCDGKECDAEKNGYDFKDAKNPKNSFRPAKHEEGNAKKANKGYKTVKVQEGAEPLAWHQTGRDARGNMADTYMDKSHGTEIGSSAPFDDATADNIDAASKNPVTSTSKMRNGVVKEDSLIYDHEDNIESPKAGTGKIGKNDPFNGKRGKDITEDLDDVNDNADVEDGSDMDYSADDEGIAEGSYDDAEDMDTDDYSADDDMDTDDYDGADMDDDDSYDDDSYDDDSSDPDIADLQDQVSDLSRKMDAVLDAVGADEPTVDSDEYEDDDLYGDDDYDDDSDEDIEDCTVYESRSFRKMRMNEARNARRNRRLNEDGMKPFSDRGRVPAGNMNKLSDFGKHPAYQKKVMSLPPKDMQEFPNYYDMNDESVRSDAPYGQKIGDGAPFVVDPEEIENAIAESIKRHLGKKLVR